MIEQKVKVFLKPMIPIKTNHVREVTGPDRPEQGQTPVPCPCLRR